MEEELLGHICPSAIPFDRYYSSRAASTSVPSLDVFSFFRLFLLARVDGALPLGQVRVDRGSAVLVESETLAAYLRHFFFLIFSYKLLLLEPIRLPLSLFLALRS